MDSGTFGVYAVPLPGGDLAALEKKLDAFIAQTLKTGITQKELDRSRRVMKAETVYTLDSQNSMANVFGRALVGGRTVKHILSYPDRLDAVTLDDINKAAAKVLKIKRSVTGFLLNGKSK